MPPDPLPAPPAVLAAAQPTIAPTPIPPDATEEQLIGLWLHGKSPNTIRAYRRDIAAFRAFIGKPIRLAYLGDLQRYADALGGSPASLRPPVVGREVAALVCRPDGLHTVQHRRCDPAATARDRLAERILDERQVFALLDAVEQHPRDHALIRLLYNGRLRVSEAVTLQWRNLVDGVVNIRGKGGRTRVVRLSRGTWAELQAFRPAGALDDRVFPMTAWNAWDRVRRAARTAGLEALVSPALPAPLARHACPAPRRGPGHRARDARPRVALDHGTLPSRPAREIQRRLPRRLTTR
jgi:integrase/recombinase XerD